MKVPLIEGFFFPGGALYLVISSASKIDDSWPSYAKFPISYIFGTKGQFPLWCTQCPGFIDRVYITLQLWLYGPCAVCIIRPGIENGLCSRLLPEGRGQSCQRLAWFEGTMELWSVELIESLFPTYPDRPSHFENWNDGPFGRISRVCIFSALLFYDRGNECEGNLGSHYFLQMLNKVLIKRQECRMR